MSKKQWFASLAALSALTVGVSLAGCGTNSATSPGSGGGGSTSSSSPGSTSTQPVRSLTIAYMPNMGGASTLAVAEHMGYFKAAGLNVKLDVFQTGPTELDAMASGRIDIAYIGAGAAFLPMKGAAKIFFIDSIGLGDGIVTSKSSGITNPAGLKGQSVLVPTGTTGEIILYEALHSVGLPLSSVTMVNTSPSAQVPAFLSNRAPVMAGWVPNTTEILDKAPGSHLLVSDKTFYPQVSLPGIWTASNALAAHHPNTIKRFIWAMLQAVNYKAAHLNQAVQWTAQMTNVPAPLLQETVQWSVFPTKSQLLDYYKKGQVQSWFDYLAKTFVAMGVLHSAPSYSQYATSKLILAASKMNLKA